jgi:hypothetical protein
MIFPGAVKFLCLKLTVFCPLHPSIVAFAFFEQNIEPSKKKTPERLALAYENGSTDY